MHTHVHCQPRCQPFATALMHAEKVVMSGSAQGSAEGTGGGSKRKKIQGKACDRERGRDVCNKNPFGISAGTNILENLELRTCGQRFEAVMHRSSSPQP